MTEKEVYEKLVEWADRISAFEAVYDVLHDLTRLPADCKLVDSVYRIVDGYTDSLSELVGDPWEYMSYYQLECGMGKTPKPVVLENGTRILLSSIEDLAAIIAIESNLKGKTDK